MTDGIPIGAVVAGAVIVAVVFALFSLVKSILYICAPDEVLIFSGRSQTLDTGERRGFRVVFGGRAWRVPLIEKVDRMNLNTIAVPISITGAYSKGGIRLNVDAVAHVKISSNERIVGNAIERFLGREQVEIKRVAQETLEGHLRGVIATLTPEEVNEDRLKFADQLSDESEEDLNKLGIHIDTFKITHVTDDDKYLDSIGREAIANVIKAAEIAESNAKRDAEQAEAGATGRARVTIANVDEKVAEMKNTLRRIRAELDAEIKSEQERSMAAAREARAVAEQELQTVRAKVETIRLKADAVLPAEAERQARELQARGDAATLREQGEAVSKALGLLNDAFADAGPDALSIYLIEELEQILETVVSGVKKVQIENLNLIDGGDGKTLASYVSAYPAMMSAVFDGITDTIGMDIPKIVSGLNKRTNGSAAVRPRAAQSKKIEPRQRRISVTGPVSSAPSRSSTGPALSASSGLGSARSTALTPNDEVK